MNNQMNAFSKHAVVFLIYSYLLFQSKLIQICHHFRFSFLAKQVLKRSSYFSPEFEYGLLKCSIVYKTKHVNQATV